MVQLGQVTWICFEGDFFTGCTMGFITISHHHLGDFFGFFSNYPKKIQDHFLTFTFCKEGLKLYIYIYIRPRGMFGSLFFEERLKLCINISLFMHFLLQGARSKMKCPSSWGAVGVDRILSGKQLLCRTLLPQLHGV